MANGEQTIRTMANETRILIQKLSEVAVNDVISDEQLALWIGKDCRPNQPGYGYLQSAIRSLLRDRVVFDRVRNVGIKRVDDVGALEIGGSYIHRCHNSAIKGQKVVAASEYKNLPRDKQLQHNVLYAMLGGLRLMSKPSAQKKLAAATEKRGGLLPTAEVLEQFK